ncbi:MAG: hypothetical protein MJ131_09935, partial [Lachnospiraceae bacterium]|nr:hypothetical protein [Lachnospiraceae bacterium]
QPVVEAPVQPVAPAPEQYVAPVVEAPAQPVVPAPEQYVAPVVEAPVQPAQPVAPAPEQYVAPVAEAPAQPVVEAPVQPVAPAPEQYVAPVVETPVQPVAPAPEQYVAPIAEAPVQPMPTMPTMPQQPEQPEQPAPEKKKKNLVPVFIITGVVAALAVAAVLLVFVFKVFPIGSDNNDEEPVKVVENIDNEDEKKPEPTELPAVTEAPEPTEAPEVTEAPVVTEAPEEIATPIPTEEPVITEAPEVTPDAGTTEDGKWTVADLDASLAQDAAYIYLDEYVPVGIDKYVLKMNKDEFFEYTGLNENECQSVDLEDSYSLFKSCGGQDDYGAVVEAVFDKDTEDVVCIAMEYDESEKDWSTVIAEFYRNIKKNYRFLGRAELGSMFYSFWEDDDSTAILLVNGGQLSIICAENEWAQNNPENLYVSTFSLNTIRDSGILNTDEAEADSFLVSILNSDSDDYNDDYFDDYDGDDYYDDYDEDDYYDDDYYYDYDDEDDYGYEDDYDYGFEDEDEYDGDENDGFGYTGNGSFLNTKNNVPLDFDMSVMGMTPDEYIEYTGCSGEYNEDGSTGMFAYENEVEDGYSNTVMAVFDEGKLRTIVCYYFPVEGNSADLYKKYYEAAGRQFSYIGHLFEEGETSVVGEKDGILSVITANDTIIGGIYFDHDYLSANPESMTASFYNEIIVEVLDSLDTDYNDFINNI